LEKFDGLIIFLENLVEKLARMFSWLYQKLMPAILKNFINSSVNKIESVSSKTINKISSTASAIKSDSVNWKSRSQEGFEKKKQKGEAALAKVKDFDYKSHDYKKSALLVFAFLTPILLKIKQWYLGLKPTTFLLIVTTTSMGTVSSVAIYKHVSKLAEETAKANGRTPAAAITQYKQARPQYYKVGEKHFRILNIAVPAYAPSSPTTYRKMLIDFTMISSNRYIREFFFANIHLLKDRLNTRIEPISVSFPLEDEGKTIIKDKLKEELNVLLKELKIKGEIEEIYIHSIIAG
jgi:hypothetical protein